MAPFGQGPLAGAECFRPLSGLSLDAWSICGDSLGKQCSRSFGWFFCSLFSWSRLSIYNIYIYIHISIEFVYNNYIVVYDIHIIFYE